MGYFYFDESIHSRAGFILGAYVYTEEPLEPAVASVLAHLGLRPGVDEFKSGTRIPSDPTEAKLRHDLRDQIRQLYGRIGLVIAPHVDRDLLGLDALRGLEKLISRNDFDTSVHTVYFDEGIYVPPTTARRVATAIGLSDHITIEASTDSKVVGGIQVADLAAHTMATMLLEHLGFVTKQVKAGLSSGYDPELEFELGFELWASLRNQFFRCAFSEPAEGFEMPSPILDVASCGLYISERCDERLRDAALARFGSVYLGCIH